SRKKRLLAERATRWGRSALDQPRWAIGTKAMAVALTWTTAMMIHMSLHAIRRCLIIRDLCMLPETPHLILSVLCSRVQCRGLLGGQIGFISRRVALSSVLAWQ